MGSRRNQESDLLIDRYRRADSANQAAKGSKLERASALSYEKDLDAAANADIITGTVVVDTD